MNGERVRIGGPYFEDFEPGAASDTMVLDWRFVALAA
jgi:hypothetical protein